MYQTECQGNLLDTCIPKFQYNAQLDQIKLVIKYTKTNQCATLILEFDKFEQAYKHVLEEREKVIKKK